MRHASAGGQRSAPVSRSATSATPKPRGGSRGPRAARGALMNYTITEANKRKAVTKEEADRILRELFGKHADDLPYDWRGKEESPA